MLISLYNPLFMIDYYKKINIFTMQMIHDKNIIYVRTINTHNK